MTDNTPQFDDPQWTAWVLGELPTEEQHALEERLQRDPAARAEVETLRETVALVFAALQSEPREELTSQQRQRIRAAASRQLASIAAVRPALHEGIGGGRPRSSPAGFARRGAVLLASLAMVAVALLVASLTPDSRPTAVLASRAGSGFPVDHTDFLVLAPGEFDANGNSNIDLAYRVVGNLDGTAVRFDDSNGLYFVDTRTAAPTGTTRQYVTPNGFAPGLWEDTTAAGAGGAVEYLYDASRPVIANGGHRFLTLETDSNHDGIDAYEQRWREERSRVRESAEDVRELERARQWSVLRSQGQRFSDFDAATTPSAAALLPAQAGAESAPGEGGGAPKAERDVLLQKARGEGESQDFGTVAGKEGGQSQGMPRDFSKATRGLGASANEGQDSLGLGARRAVDAESLDKLSEEEARKLQRHYSSLQSRPADESKATPHPANRAVRAKDQPALDGFSILPMQDPAATVTANAPVAQSAAEHLQQQSEQQLQPLAREQLERLTAAVRLQVEQRPVEAAQVQLEALIEQQERAPSVSFMFRQPADRTLSLSERETSEAKYTEYFARLHAEIGDQVSGGEIYARIAEQDFSPTLETPLWTLATDVDTASYANVRRFLDDGQWPPADAVRVEELVNYFPYEYAPPDEEHPVSIAVEAAACPWQPQHRLARVALKAREIDESRRPPTSLVFLVDVSGSMNEANKLPLVQQSLGLLVDQLTENDRIGLVTYANEARTVFSGVSGERRPEIRSAVDALSAAGSTNGAGGLTLAYSVARECFLPEGNNRVILCSDGDFNVGISDDDELVRLIETERQSGVFLSIFGFGTGNLKDAKLEALADHGNGQYAYIDSLDEARKALVEELWGTLYTVAKDVKLQIDFNPLQVESYRVVGYENRTLAAEDFDNDAVDAGDLGSGHTMTALVEYVPRIAAAPEQSPQLSEAVNQRSVRFGALDDGLVEVRRQGDAVTIEGEVYSEGRKAEFDKSVQALFGMSNRRRMRVENRLKVVDRPAAEGGRVPFNDTLTVRLRYKQPGGQESTRLDVSLVDAGRTAAPSDDFQWASAVAAFGMLLRQSEYQGLANFESVLETAQAAKGNDPTGRRREFIDLVRRARALWSSGHGIELAQPEPLPSTEAYAKASVAGKYDQLLEKVVAPDDFRSYGAFHDYGRWDGTTYLGRTGLPTGYWVYVYPDWFIWGAEHPDAAASEVHPASPVP